MYLVKINFFFWFVSKPMGGIIPNRMELERKMTYFQDSFKDSPSSPGNQGSSRKNSIDLRIPKVKLVLGMAGKAERVASSFKS